MKHNRSLLLKLAFVFQSSTVQQNPDMMEISFLCAVQYSRPLVTYTHQLSTWNVPVWDFPGSPEVRTQCFHGGGLGSIPGLISYKSQSTANKQTQTKQNKIRNVHSEIVKIRNFSFFLRLLFIIIFWPHCAAWGILVPWQESNPGPWQWECQVPTTGLPGNSQEFLKCN